MSRQTKSKQTSKKHHNKQPQLTYLNQKRLSDISVRPSLQIETDENEEWKASQNSQKLNLQKYYSNSNNNSRKRNTQKPQTKPKFFQYNNSLNQSLIQKKAFTGKRIQPKILNNQVDAHKLTIKRTNNCNNSFQTHQKVKAFQKTNNSKHYNTYNSTYNFQEQIQITNKIQRLMVKYTQPQINNRQQQFTKVVRPASLNKPQVQKETLNRYYNYKFTPCNKRNQQYTSQMQRSQIKHSQKNSKKVQFQKSNERFLQKSKSTLVLNSQKVSKPKQADIFNQTTYLSVSKYNRNYTLISPRPRQNANATRSPYIMRRQRQTHNPMPQQLTQTQNPSYYQKKKIFSQFTLKPENKSYLHSKVQENIKFQTQQKEQREVQRQLSKKSTKNGHHQYQYAKIPQFKVYKQQKEIKSKKPQKDLNFDLRNVSQVKNKHISKLRANRYVKEDMIIPEESSDQSQTAIDISFKHYTCPDTLSQTFIGNDYDQVLKNRTHKSTFQETPKYGKQFPPNPLKNRSNKTVKTSKENVSNDPVFDFAQNTFGKFNNCKENAQGFKSRTQQFSKSFVLQERPKNVQVSAPVSKLVQKGNKAIVSTCKVLNSSLLIDNYGNDKRIPQVSVANLMKKYDFQENNVQSITEVFQPDFSKKEAKNTKDKENNLKNSMVEVDENFKDYLLKVYNDEYKKLKQNLS